MDCKNPTISQKQIGGVLLVETERQMNLVFDESKLATNINSG